MPEQAHDTELSFEQAYNRIEEITQQLEKGDTTLEESFELFEEAQKLLVFSNKTLDNSEKRLKIIQNGHSGYEIKEEVIE